MKRQIPYWTIIILTVLCLMQGCVKDPVPSQFGKPSLSVSYGEVSSSTVLLTCRISTTNYKECGFYYGTKQDLSDKKIVKVFQGNDKKSAEVMLSNLEPGTTYYFQAYVDGGRSIVTSGISSITTIRPVNSVTLSQTSLTLKLNQSVTLTASVYPSNATDKTVTWTSSDTAVATVNYGTVRGKSGGTAIITAKAGDKTATCTVTVDVPVTWINLNYNALTLYINDSFALTADVGPLEAADKTVAWTSSNTSIATVSNGTVTTKSAGTAIITAKVGNISESCMITVIMKKKQPVQVSVDLGLSVRWSNSNIGANAPEEYGDYYAWGESTTKSDYSWSTYKWCNGTIDSLTKYNTNSSYGTVDNKTRLDLSDDVARSKWGGKWRMPTREEFDELRSKCTWTWANQVGNNGYKVTGTNGNSIFLPAAGYRSSYHFAAVGKSGRYWSANILEEDAAFCAGGFDFHSGIFGWCYGCDRSDGYSVRPVTDE